MLPQRQRNAKKFDQAVRPLAVTKDRIVDDLSMVEFVPFPGMVPAPGSKLVDEKFPDEIKTYCFQVWAFICDRSPSRTATFCRDPTVANLDHLAFPLYEGFPISLRTITEWAKINHWGEKADAMFREIIPDVWEQTARTTLLGAHEGTKWLRLAANGEIELTREDRTRVEAIKILLDRSGFLPWSRQNFEQPHGPKQDFAGLVSGMSDDELASDLARTAMNLKEHP